MAIYNYGLPVNYQTPMAYQPQYPQMQQTVSTTPINTHTNSSGIIWVQGEAGAKAYPVAPGNSVLLMDSEHECFYIKSTDTSGIPMPLRAFTYTEIVQTQPKAQEEIKIDTSQFVTRAEFDELKQMLNDRRPMQRKESKDEQTVSRNTTK